MLALEPLADDDAATLAGGVDEQTLRRILDVAEGNPLFVEQLVALRAEGGDELDVPPTLQALLAARIDSLAAPERIVVERASVEGRLFHRGSVVELAPEHVRPDVGAHLLALVRKEFVRPDRAQLPGDDGYRFAHVLVRDAAYESMAKELRAELHERFAAWLGARRRRPAGRAGGDPRLPPRAGRPLPARARPPGRERRRTPRGRAAGARGHARLRPRRRQSGGRTCSAARCALLPPGDPLRVRALPLLGAAIYGAAGGMERALDVLAQALDESRAAGDPRGGGERLGAASSSLSIDSVPGTDIGGIQREVGARAPEIEQLGDARALVSLRRLELEHRDRDLGATWKSRQSGC